MKRRFIQSISPGLAFPDYIGKSEGRRKKHVEGFDKYLPFRSFFLLLCLFLGIGILSIKLLSVQIFGSNYYQNLSDGNRIRTDIIHAPRGVIFDRNGIPLVYNVPGFRSIINGKTVFLTRDQAIAQLIEGKQQFSIDSLRQYPYKDITAHVLGYIGQISQEELKISEYKAYRPDDIIGKGGIEQVYEGKLKGIDGKKLVEINAIGKDIRILGQTDPIPGENINITLDIKLQQKAYAAMRDIEKGAVIVSTPKGEILALISKPSFDPNLFTLGKSYEATDSAYKDIASILSDNNGQPLLNRSISGVYPPGSTFKLVTAVAGLENNLIDESFQVEDTGVLRVGSFSFATWYFTKYGKTEGYMNVTNALKRSNDIFFYKLAEKIGLEKLSETASKFGIGKKTGIDLFGEAKGLLPSNKWKQEVVGDKWYLGDTYHYGIGQGYLLTTPLQVNVWTQAIVNKGGIYTPHLLKNSKFKVQSSKLLSEKTVSLIRQGMIESCQPGGVAWPLFKLKIKNEKLKIDGENFLEVLESTRSAQLKEYREVSIACKTGTAQHGTEQTLPHAWITLWAPAYNPEIIITVLAESSGEGSNVAGPVAKEILEEWFSR